MHSWLRIASSPAPLWWEEVETLAGMGAKSVKVPARDASSLVRMLKRMPDEHRLAIMDELRTSALLTSPPESSYLRREDLGRLEQMGIEIGNHTQTHPCLPRCPADKMERNSLRMNDRLEAMLGHLPRAFAYPNGDWDGRAEHVLTKLGYEAAFLFDHRLAEVKNAHPLRISRLRTNDADSPDRFPGSSSLACTHPSTTHWDARGPIEYARPSAQPPAPAVATSPRGIEPRSRPAQQPLAEPSVNDYIIAGHSRSGTTLLAAALQQPPRSLTVIEPWDGMRLEPASLFESLRYEAMTGTMGRGRLDFNELKRSGDGRWCRDGERPYRLQVDPGFALGVKWPVFWRYLPLLHSTKFLLCVRHPVEVIGSFERTGRLADGLDYDVPFNREMNDELRRATDDPAVRRALLFEYVAKMIAPFLDHPNVFVVRFERWFDDPGGLMRDVGRFIGVTLGPGYARVRRPLPVGARPELNEHVERYCPSAKSLGYGIHGKRAREVRK